MSRASTSGVSRAKAFFDPSGLLELIRDWFPKRYAPRSVTWRNPIPDESVDLDSVDIVQLLESDLDLPLVGFDVDDEDQGVVLLNLLHRALGVERVEDDLVRVEASAMGDGLAGVLGRSGELESLGAVEGGGGADLARLVRLH